MALVSLLITMFSVMFWIFRVVITVTTSLNINMGFEIQDLTIEIVMLFIALLALVLIVRRHFLGAIIYIISYGWYFGGQIFSTVMNIQQGESLTAKQGLNVFVSFVAVILALATFVDIAINKNRKGSTTDKKTDWFYKNQQFDREFDERADRNNYKF